MVEVDVGDQHGVGQRDVLGQELLAEVGAGVDEQRLARGLAPDVDRKAGALDAELAGALAGVAVAADGGRPGRVAGAEQRDLHGSSVVVVRLVGGRPVRVVVLIVVPVVVGVVVAAVRGLARDEVRVAGGAVVEDGDARAQREVERVYADRAEWWRDRRASSWSTRSAATAMTRFCTPTRPARWCGSTRRPANRCRCRARSGTWQRTDRDGQFSR